MADGSKKYSGGLLPEKVAPEYFTHYESKEFTVSTGQTNYDVKSNVTGAFTVVRSTHGFIIRTDQDITIKLNDSANDAITVTAAEGQLVIDATMRLEVTNIFITNASGSTANVKAILIP